MALVNGAGYPIMVANALMPFPESSGKAAALQNTLQLGLCFVAKHAGVGVYCPAAVGDGDGDGIDGDPGRAGVFPAAGKSGRCAAKGAAGTC